MYHHYMFFFIIFLLSNLLFANDEINTYCFESSSKLKSVRGEIDFLVTQADKINLKSNCMDIYTNQQRSELFAKYIKANFPQVKITSSLSYKQTCKMKLTEKSRVDEDSSTYGVNSKTLTVQKGKSKINADKITSLILLEGTSSSIQYENKIINLKCFVRGSTYHIELSANSPTLSFSTSRTLSKGSRIEIGSVVESAQKDDSTKSLGGVKLEKSNTNSDTVMYLEFL